LKYKFDIPHLQTKEDQTVKYLHWHLLLCLHGM